MLTFKEYFSNDSYIYLPQVKALYENLGHFGTTTEEYREFLSQGYLTLVFIDNNLIAYSILSLDVPVLGNDFFNSETDSYIFHIYVAKESQGQGLGTELLHRAENKSKEYGRTRVFVETQKNNDGMIKLLEKENYTFLELRDYTEQYADSEALYKL